jgi:hypothetical protein
VHLFEIGEERLARELDAGVKTTKAWNKRQDIGPSERRQACHQGVRELCLIVHRFTERPFGWRCLCSWRQRWTTALPRLRPRAWLDVVVRPAQRPPHGALLRPHSARQADRPRPNGPPPVRAVVSARVAASARFSCSVRFSSIMTKTTKAESTNSARSNPNRKRQPRAKVERVPKRRVGRPPALQADAKTEAMPHPKCYRGWIL